MITNGRIAVAHVSECGRIAQAATLIDLVTFFPFTMRIVECAHIVAIYDDHTLRIVKNRLCGKMNELPFDELRKVHELVRMNDVSLTLR